MDDDLAEINLGKAAKTCQLLLGAWTPGKFSPGFTEELVLNEKSDGKHDNSLDGHGAQILAHHLPAKRVLEAILAYE